jgi:D-alanyl-D-alanine carboxypeptidase
VFAKTGTLTGVISLSGIIRPEHSDPILFSFLSNNVKDSYATRDAIDDCVKLFTNSPTAE